MRWFMVAALLLTVPAPASAENWQLIGSNTLGQIFEIDVDSYRGNEHGATANFSMGGAHVEQLHFPCNGIVANLTTGEIGRIPATSVLEVMEHTVCTSRDLLAKAHR